MFTRFILSVISFIFVGNSYGKVFTIDKEHTNVGFTVKHLMISKVRGHFKSFTGIVDFNIENKSFKKMDANIMVQSIDTNEKERDTHLLSADFFNLKNPQDMIKFSMKSYSKKDNEQGVAKGILEIRGIKKEVELNIKIGGIATDPWGNERFAFEAMGKINRNDFGLKWNKAIETGGVLVDSIVEIVIEAQGIAK